MIERYTKREMGEERKRARKIIKNVMEGEREGCAYIYKEKE